MTKNNKGPIQSQNGLRILIFFIYDEQSRKSPQNEVSFSIIDSLLFQCFELPCACTYFFAVKTLRFTCLSIKLLCDTAALV